MKAAMLMGTIYNAKLLIITRWLGDLQLPTAGKHGKLCIFIKPNLNEFCSDSLPVFEG
jgi:hypothetical protein